MGLARIGGTFVRTGGELVTVPTITNPNFTSNDSEGDFYSFSTISNLDNGNAYRAFSLDCTGPACGWVQNWGVNRQYVWVRLHFANLFYITSLLWNWEVWYSGTQYAYTKISNQDDMLYNAYSPSETTGYYQKFGQYMAGDYSAYPCEYLEIQVEGVEISLYAAKIWGSELKGYTLGETY